MSNGRLPPAPPRPPIPASVSESCPPDTFTTIRKALLAMRPAPARDDTRPQSVAAASKFDGRAVTYGPATQETIDGALRHLDWVEAAVADGDAKAAAERAIELTYLLLQLESDSVAKPILAGFGTMQSPGRPRTVTDAQIVAELDMQHELHPEWGITALREAAGESLGISSKQIYRRTKHDPRLT